MKKKSFYVVAYDISDTKRRAKVVKVLQRVGIRVNLSVFECMVNDTQFNILCHELEKIVIPKEDQINIYYLCTNCFSKIKYIPKDVRKIPETIVVI